MDTCIKSERVPNKFTDNAQRYTRINCETGEILPMFVRIKLTEDAEPIELHNVDSIIVTQEEDMSIITYHYISRSDGKMHCFRAIDYSWFTIRADCNDNTANSDGDIK